MTPHDFIFWLEGYLKDKEVVDASVIEAKLSEVARWNFPAQQPIVIGTPTIMPLPYTVTTEVPFNLG